MINSNCYLSTTDVSCPNNQISEKLESSNQSICGSSCVEKVNNSGSCSQSCPQFNYISPKYGSCLECETSYDGGTYFSRNTGVCVSSCKYFNNYSAVATANSSFYANQVYQLVCEDEADPPNV